jgi:hypothetical protein
MNNDRPELVNAFHAVMALRDKGTITPTAFRVYEALWHHGPLPKKELGRTLEAWDKLPFKSYNKDLKFVIENGLVAEEKGQLNVTDRTELTVVPPPPKKPSKKKFAKGVEELEMALMRGERLGLATPESLAVMAWVKSKV